LAKNPRKNGNIRFPFFDVNFPPIVKKAFGGQKRGSKLAREHLVFAKKLSATINN